MYSGRRTIRAKFNGACRGCKKRITKGEVIIFQAAFKSWHEKCWKTENLHRLEQAREDESNL